MTIPVSSTDPLVLAIEERRVAEKEQARFYRALAVAAEESGDEALAERIQGLRADEQHQLSRLSARLVEMGLVPAEVALPAVSVTLLDWESVARAREAREISAYETLLEGQLDDRTREIFAESLEVERHHERDLDGKWTMA